MTVRNQRGLSESTQFALLWPLLMLVTVGFIQAGVWVHGHNVAQRAAAAAADSASGSYGTPGEAGELAQRIAAAGGLSSVQVRISKGATAVTVDVSGNAPVSLDLGLGLGRITETASSPIERVTQP